LLYVIVKLADKPLPSSVIIFSALLANMRKAEAPTCLIPTEELIQRDEGRTKEFV